MFQKELREEDKRYREYLRQLKEQERLREQELERLCDAEVEKMWDRKVAQWRLEKQARQQLLQEVMQFRQRQLQEKCEFPIMASTISPVDSGSYIVSIAKSLAFHSFSASQ